MFSDLHIHSNYSIDGVGQLNSMVKSASLSIFNYIAIADHNTLDHHVILNEYAEKYSFLKQKLIYACEMSCVTNLNGEEYHILGYWREHPSSYLFPEIHELTAQIKEVLNKQFLLMLEEFNNSEQNCILKHWNKYKSAELAISVPEQPFIINLYNRSLKEIDRENFKKKRRLIKHNLSRSSSWAQLPSSKEVISCINKSHGIAVFAHPSRYNIPDYKLEQIVKDLREEGISGLEIDSEKILDYCIKYNLAPTNGSDLHNLEQFGRQTHLGLLNQSVNIKSFIKKLHNAK